MGTGCESVSTIDDTRSSGTSGTVSATAEPAAMVLLPIRGNAKVRVRVQARSVDSSPSTRVRGAQDALRAQVMVGNCTRNPTKKVVSTKMIRSFMFMKNNFVVVLRTTMTLEQAEMARIQGVNVRAMAGKVVPTRRTRGRRAAWFFPAREAGTAPAVPTCDDFFSMAATVIPDAASAVPVSGSEID